VEALAECGFTRPTNIQHEALPAILATDDHTLIASETGNGKTLCFLIPMLQNIIRLKEANLNRYRAVSPITNEISMKDRLIDA
jgi:superfamily II DNA/RNA helicase